ncbi:MAG: tartrate-resistant acid phosphatase type 5 family protein [Cyclobacteriaceae bacterium]
MNTSLQFCVIGDWGRRGQFRQKETATQLAKTAQKVLPDFVISTGDNFYDAGVESLDDPNWQESFEDIYDQESLQIPWYVVLGNHDYDGSVRAQIDYSLISQRWNLPARYYTLHQYLDQEDVLLLFTDTSPFIQEYYEAGKSEIMAQDKYRQLEWLENELAQSTAKWKIVIGHHPVFSSSPYHGNADELIDTFVPLFKRYHVDLYLSGHEHDLQLQKPLGTTYYLVSGAGSEMRDTGRNDITRFSSSNNGFALITLEDDSLSICFTDDTGNDLFREKIEKQAALRN